MSEKAAMIASPPVMRIKPNAGAATLLALSVRRLPRKDRERYRDEFRAELCAVGPLRQVGVATSYLLAARSLGRVLSENAGAWPAYLGPRPLEGSMNPVWTCRIGIHRYMKVKEGDYPPTVYQECRHCGKVKHPSRYGQSGGAMYTPPAGDTGGGMSGDS